MKVKVDIATLPKDAEVSVQGLGVLKNGHTYDFDTEQEHLYCTLNNVPKAPNELNIGFSPKKSPQSTPVEAENKTPADADKKEGS